MKYKNSLQLNKYDICNKLHLSKIKRSVILIKYTEDKIENLKTWKQILKDDNII